MKNISWSYSNWSQQIKNVSVILPSISLAGHSILLYFKFVYVMCIHQRRSKYHEPQLVHIFCDYVQKIIIEKHVIINNQKMNTH